jgi:hypothetical protein
MKQLLSILCLLVLVGCKTSEPNTITYTVPQFSYAPDVPTLPNGQRATSTVPGGPVPLNKYVSLEWDYIGNTNGMLFKVYGSTNIATPLGNWQVLTNTKAGGALKAVVNMKPSECYFYVTASNYWGEATPSNTAGLPPPPFAIGTTTITE